MKRFRSSINLRAVTLEIRMVYGYLWNVYKANKIGNALEA